MMVIASSLTSGRARCTVPSAVDKSPVISTVGSGLLELVDRVTVLRREGRLFAILTNSDN